MAAQKDFKAFKDFNLLIHNEKEIRNRTFCNNNCQATAGATLTKAQKLACNNLFLSVASEKRHIINNNNNKSVDIP